MSALYFGVVKQVDFAKSIHDFSAVRLVHHKLLPFDFQYRINMWENSEFISDNLRGNFLKQFEGDNLSLCPTYLFWSDEFMAFKSWSNVLKKHVIYLINMKTQEYSLVINKCDKAEQEIYNGEVFDKEIMQRIKSYNKLNESDDDLDLCDTDMSDLCDTDMSDQFDTYMSDQFDTDDDN